MSRRLIYMAHPVAPTEGEMDAARIEAVINEPWTAPTELAISRNIKRALRWLAWLRASFPETTFIAPWIATIESLGGDDSPALREAGLVDDCMVVERCDGIVLVGGRISSGMRREMEHGVHADFCRYTTGTPRSFEVYDLTKYIIEGASGRNSDHRTFEQWMRGYRESCTR